MYSIKCLKINEIEILITNIVNNTLDNFLSEPEGMYQDAINYDLQIILINYFTPRIIEKINKRQTFDINNVIDEIYNLSTKLFFKIQELDYKFIEYLYNKNREIDFSIEDLLINSYQDFLEFKYEH